MAALMQLRGRWLQCHLPVRILTVFLRLSPPFAIAPQKSSVLCRSLQVKLDQPVSEPPSPRALSDVLAQSNGGDTAANLANNIHALRQEGRERE